MESYKIPLLALLPLTFLSLTSTSAPAQILYDNGSVTADPSGNVSGYGYYADAANPPYTVDNPYYSEAGDVFTPQFGLTGTVGTVNSVDFYGLYYNAALPDGTPPATNSFVFSLYSADSGAPDALISSTSFTLPNVLPTVVGIHTTSGGTSYTVYEFSGLLQTPFTITSGTPYYFGISDTTAATPDSSKNFAVVISDPLSVPPGASDSEYSLESGTTSTFLATGPDYLAFQLDSAPEPKGWGLVGLACLGLVWARKYARRSPLA